MAQEIRFDYDAMKKAVNDINALADKYRAEGEKFAGEGGEFDNAISQWEGNTKNAMRTFITVPVKEYVATTVPNLLKALAELLNQNAEQMQKADQEIASNIPQSLG